jgi:predicted DsbA family dithiol-disulfide isomerase
MELNGWIIELIEFTDPYCTWCWASEPILRKIKEHYGDQVKISFKMGGLVDSIDTFFDSSNRIGGEDMFDQVADHWEEASSRHGMPVDSGSFRNLKGKFRSTHPANIAYKAAQLQDSTLADRFLRRLREAAAAERKEIHSIDTQVSLAKEVGLDPDKFIASIKNGRAESDFLEELREVRTQGITGFPTFRLSNRQGESFLLYGFRRFEQLEIELKKLSNNTLKKLEISLNDENILNFIKKYEKVATQEVAILFDISRTKAAEVLQKLEYNKLITSIKAGNDYFWKLNTNFQ